jgi:hypothetical protein
MKVLKYLLNALWRSIAFVGIMITGAVVTNYFADKAVHLLNEGILGQSIWYICVISTFITGIGFSFWYLTMSKDVIKITWKVTKDKGEKNVKQ